MLDLESLLEVAEGLSYLSNPPEDKALALYPYVIDYLMSFEHDDIRHLAEILWELVMKAVVMLRTDLTAKNLTFTVEHCEGLFYEGTLVVPTMWHSLFLDDPIFQVGGVLYTGSQAIDFYNGRLLGEKESQVKLRSQAYEAELLHQTRLEIPEYTFLPYQERVLKEFPLGLASPSAAPLLYTSKPVVMIEA